MGFPKDLDEYTDQELARELEHRAERRYYGRCDYCNRLKDEGESWCKFPRRHMAALTQEEAKKVHGK